MNSSNKLMPSTTNTNNATLQVSQYNSSRSNYLNGDLGLTQNSNSLSLNNINELQLNGENFILMPVNGNKLNLNKEQNFTAYRVSKETANELDSSIFSCLVGSLFPHIALAEQLMHLSETVTKLQEDRGFGFNIRHIQNINPKEAINPKNQFMVSTSNSMSSTTNPPMELWQKRRMQKDVELNNKKKNKKIGLFS